MKRRSSHLVPLFTDYATKWLFLPLDDRKPTTRLRRWRSKPQYLPWNKRQRPKA